MIAIFLDIETTGLDPLKHSPIDIALKVVDTSSGELKATYQSVIKQGEEQWEKRDLESMKINGYTWDKIQEGKELSVVSQDVLKLFKSLKIKRGEAVFICQNPAFDRGFFNHIIPVYTQEKLNWPYHWLDLASMYWASVVKNQGFFPLKTSLSKNSIGEQYRIPEEVTPHLAINGVDHLIQCYAAVLGLDWKPDSKS
jgi:DNA polymerase-3 subunit epsilon/oligoribonuclease